MIRKDKRTQEKRTTKGITLIALVVTIVVLLILAGVTINAILGDNGIIAQARRVADAAKEAAKNDEDNIKELSDELNSMLSSEEEKVEPEPPKEPTLEVKLKVDEEQTTGAQIPVSVEKVTNKADNSDVAQENLIYTWSYEGYEEYKDGSTHTFSGLDEQESYTLKCKVETEDGEWGTGEVTVISFKIHTKYYRATKGMSWYEFTTSKYDKSAPILSDLESTATHDESREGHPLYVELSCEWDVGNVGFACGRCRPSMGAWDDGTPCRAFVLDGESSWSGPVAR